jgi:phage baseplate assembly protein gpV
MPDLTDVRAGDEAESARGERFFGKYRGIVTDNMDPNNLGRVRALVPEVLGEVVTGWASPCAPYFGTQTGFFAMPPVGAGVWIEFEAGDLSRPIWVGGWWGTQDVPMGPMGARTTPNTKILRSEGGLIVVLDDSAQKISVSDAAGTSSVVVDVAAGNVTLRAPTRVVFESPQVLEGSGGAAHPAVFGDQLLTYLNQLVTMFNAHVHPGELAAGILPVTPAPPVPPFPAATAALLSLKVKLE